MKLLNRKSDTDPVTEGVPTVGPHGERVILTPFQPEHTEGDDVEGFANTSNVATPPVGRLRINITGLRSIVIK